MTHYLIFFGFFPGATPVAASASGAYAPGFPPLSFRTGFTQTEGADQESPRRYTGFIKDLGRFQNP